MTCASSCKRSETEFKSGRAKKNVQMMQMETFMISSLVSLSKYPNKQSET